MRTRMPGLLSLLPAALACSPTDDVGPEDGTTAPPGCHDDSDCEGGAGCYNGACLEPCSAGCPPGTYCASIGTYLCAPQVVDVCPATPCNRDQVCANGLCSTMPPTGFCGTDPWASDDGCGREAICLQNMVVNGTLVLDRRCFTFPPCPEHGDCPTGTHGALCNAAFFEHKDRFCLPGMCRTAAADCPLGWRCIQRDSPPLIGYCSDGAFGSACRTAEDCAAGLSCPTSGTEISTCR